MERFVLLLLSLVTVALGQGTVLPQVSSSQGPTDASCAGCYLVADVAAVVFGEELVGTATQLVSVGVGKNGTQVTTSFVQPAGQFSFASSGLVTGGSGEVSFASGTIITVSGAALTSPTAYNLFTAYSVTSLTLSNGQCVTAAGTRVQLSSAYLVPIPDNAGPDFIFAAESSFINELGGIPTCAPGGFGTVSSTTQIPTGISTATQTVTGTLRPTPQAQSTIASSTSASVSILTPQPENSSSTVSPTTTVLSTISILNATGTIIVAGNATSILTGSGSSATFIPFTGAANAVFRPTTFIAATGSTLITAFCLLVPGVLAWML